MSKELEALNKIAYSYGYDENIKIIATALEDYEKQWQIDTDLLGAAYKTNIQNQSNYNIEIFFDHIL